MGYGSSVRFPPLAEVQRGRSWAGRLTSAFEADANDRSRPASYVQAVSGPGVGSAPGAELGAAAESGRSLPQIERR